jgi:hypothetical protein
LVVETSPETFQDEDGVGRPYTPEWVVSIRGMEGTTHSLFNETEAWANGWDVSYPTVVEKCCEETLNTVERENKTWEVLTPSLPGTCLGNILKYLGNSWHIESANSHISRDLSFTPGGRSGT